MTARDQGLGLGLRGVFQGRPLPNWCSLATSFCFGFDLVGSTFIWVKSPNFREGYLVVLIPL